MAQAALLPDSIQNFHDGFAVGGISVKIRGRAEDVALVPSLVPFRSSSGNAEIEICVRRRREFTTTAEAPLFDSGSVWKLYQDRAGYRFDFSVPALGTKPYKRLLVDYQFQSAVLELNSQVFSGPSSSSIAPLDYPLDELLIVHRLSQERAIELHACGVVGADGIGNLFVGHSGAGKSTTTRLWIERKGIEILSDDRIIVRPDSGNHLRMYGTPWHGEAMYASPASSPLARILILQHGNGNVLTRLSPSEAVAELFARSFVPFHRHEYIDSALDFLQQVVDAVPVYRFAFEPDRRAVDTILHLHD